MVQTSIENYEGNGIYSDKRYSSGELRSITYYYKTNENVNIIHSDVGPAIIFYHPNGILKEIYIKHDKTHRDNGPAQIDYFEYDFENASIKTEKYFKNNEFHREDGPAIIDYDENGNIIEEKYMKNNKLYRLGGPAIIIYELGIEEHYINENYIDPKKVPFNMDKDLSEDEMAYLKLKFG